MRKTNRSGVPPILLVEDSPDDAVLSRIALEETGLSNGLTVVPDGLEALDYLRGKGKHLGAKRPAMVLLDLHLPKKSGFELLREMKSDAGLRTIPAVVLTGSRLDEDILKNYNCHPDAFINKPIDAALFLATMRKLVGVGLAVVRRPDLKN